MWQNRDYRNSEEDFKFRLHILFILVSIFFVVIGLKLFYLQIIKGPYFRYISEENRIQISRSRAPRGRVIGRRGEILLDNRQYYSAVLSKLNVGTDELKTTIIKLKSFMEIDEDKLFKRLDELKNKPFEVVRLANDIPREMMIELKENKPYLSGLEIIDDPVRRYRLGYKSAHVLGYLGEIDTNELNHLSAEGYKLGDYIGKRGLEKVYDSYLRGEDGLRKLEVDARGRQRKIVSNVPPQKGNDVYITIDFNLQVKAEHLLSNKKGSIIALDPKTGEVLAMVSSPGFDPSQFLYPLQDEKRQVLQDKDFSLMNRAIQAQYPPASVFKIITTIAGLEEGVVAPTVKHTCRGQAIFGKERRVFKCWKKKGHSRVALKQAFAESCDVYYYNLGLMIGNEKLVKYAKLFGLNAYTGIDLLSEKKGIVPNKEWKKNRFGVSWYDGDTVNMSIGQGFLLVTPIQLANLTACVANGGYLYRPYIVKKIISKEDKILFQNKPLLIRHVPVKPSTMKLVKEYMQEVVDNGTGKAGRLRDISVGGKTGTAENPHGEDHAWFVSFAPVEDPEISLCVFVENAGHGGSEAAPLAREMLKEFFRDR